MIQLWKYINEIWEWVLANSFSGIHTRKSKIICSACVFFSTCFGTKFRKFATIFVSRNGIPSCFLFFTNGSELSSENFLFCETDGIRQKTICFVIQSSAELFFVGNFQSYTCNSPTSPFGSLSSARIFNQSMGARNGVGKGLSYPPTRLHSRDQWFWQNFINSMCDIKFWKGNENLRSVYKKSFSKFWAVSSIFDLSLSHRSNGA